MVAPAFIQYKQYGAKQVTRHYDVLIAHSLQILEKFTEILNSVRIVSFFLVFFNKHWVSGLIPSANVDSDAIVHHGSQST